MLELRSVEFEGHHHQIVPTTTFTAAAGHLSLLYTPTHMARTACALMASGRMRPNTGDIALNDDAGLHHLRHSTALIDAPGITTPEHHMKVKHVVAESLALRPRPRGTSIRAHLKFTASARYFLQTYTRTYGIDTDNFANTYFESLDSSLRLDLLLTLAFADPQVQFAVVDSPDRHDITDQDLITVLSSHTSASQDPNYNSLSPQSVLAVLGHLPADEDLPEGVSIGATGSATSTSPLTTCTNEVP